MNSIDIWPILWIIFMLGLVISVIVAAKRESGPRSPRPAKSKKGKKGTVATTEANASSAVDGGFGDDGFGNADFPISDSMNADGKALA